ncbi:MAG: Asparagine synthetase [candidate division TM6 bacterium GW2011_GWF2_28_16]|nr:MAG: Asparagine synthetase [candidate division TM6 bacterium GW2011_GWF2_28_16]
MCGIAGFINLNNKNFEIDKNLLFKMQEKIRHRGPDDAGIWLSSQRGVGLAHVRLSIVDLSLLGHQPMIDKENKVIVSFNGEIYNYKNLKIELESLGYKFYSQCDTESILYAYKEWGIDFVNKLDGDFAIALFDILNNKFYLMRDKVGVKPVYYGLQNNILSFASEIKALFALPWVKKEINNNSVYDYLTFMVTPAPDSIYKNIFKLEAGSYLYLDSNKNIEIKKYYNLLENINLNNIKNNYNNENFVLENIDNLLNNSISKRMMSDTPVGAFLSGGLDSSLNVALMSKFNSKIKTFTVGFENTQELEELKYARQVAKLFNTEHHEIIITEKDAFEFFESMVYQLDEPLADPVCIPFYFVSKLARENNIKVVQVGEGADELFFGYKIYLDYKQFYDLFWENSVKFIPDIIKKYINIFGKKFINNSNYLEILYNWANNRNLFWSGAIAFNEYQKNIIFNNKNLDSFNIIKNKLKNLSDNKNFNKDFANNITYLELTLRLPELLLMRADKMSMLNGVEARVPYLDSKLIEFMLNVPVSLKVKNNVTKYLLKKVAQRYLPDNIIYRKKVGFASPIIKWFESGRYFKKYYKDLLDKEFKNNSLFLPAIKNLDNAYKYHESGLAVQKWTLQNYLTLKKINSL